MGPGEFSQTEKYEKSPLVVKFCCHFKKFQHYKYLTWITIHKFSFRFAGKSKDIIISTLLGKNPGLLSPRASIRETCKILYLWATYQTPDFEIRLTV